VTRGKIMQCKECKDTAPPLTKDFVYWECSCFKNNQPERLNPEDTIGKVDWINFKGEPTIPCVCDSPTTENK
jgi:hypothetical protein